MTVKECYVKAGLLYEPVLERLGNEAILKKFVLKFLNDPNFFDLKQGLLDADGEKAFRAAHTLKGICLNLGFDNLYKPSAEITEKLRGKKTDGCEELFAQVEAEYEKLINAIQEMASERE